MLDQKKHDEITEKLAGWMFFGGFLGSIPVAVYASGAAGLGGAERHICGTLIVIAVTMVMGIVFNAMMKPVNERRVAEHATTLEEEATAKRREEELHQAQLEWFRRTNPKEQYP